MIRVLLVYSLLGKDVYLHQLTIIGASGHGKVVADIAINLGYEEIVFLDDDTSVQSCLGFPVVGTIAQRLSFADFEYAVAIGNPRTRERLCELLLKEGLNLVTLVHPTAVIGTDVSLGIGTVIMAGAVVNPCSALGIGCIVNTAASIDHDCVIGDYSHISVGAHVAGTVYLGSRTWVGAGATVSNNLTICEDVMLGAGAVAVHDIDKPGTYVGVPARLIYRH